MGATDWAKSFRAKSIKEFKAIFKAWAVKDKSNLIHMLLREAAMYNLKLLKRHNITTCSSVHCPGIKAKDAFPILDKEGEHGVLRGKNKEYFEATPKGWRKYTLESQQIQDMLTYGGTPFIWTGKNVWYPVKDSYGVSLEFFSKHFSTKQQAMEFIMTKVKKWSHGYAVRYGKACVLVAGSVST